MHTLFDAPAQPHSPTSLSAARAIKPDAATLRQQVLDYIVAQGDAGATDEEVQQALSMSGNTERPRRTELVQRGLVEDSTRTRKTLSNRDAVVWVAKAN